jgi:hypothetical protein
VAVGAVCVCGGGRRARKDAAASQPANPSSPRPPPAHSTPFHPVLPAPPTVKVVELMRLTEDTPSGHITRSFLWSLEGVGTV